MSGAHVCPLYPRTLSIAHWGGRENTLRSKRHDARSFEDMDEMFRPVK